MHPISQIRSQGPGQLPARAEPIIDRNQVLLVRQGLDHSGDIVSEVGHVDQGQLVRAVLIEVGAAALAGVGLAERLVQAGLALAVEQPRTDHVGLHGGVLVVQNLVLERAT